jgi:hypothetical protein
MLSDEEARRIEAQLPRADPALLGRWVKALLEDRRGRNAIVLGQTRRLVHTRERLRQATEYLDSLLLKAQNEAQSLWPGKLPCPHCGAPVSQVRAEQRAQGHAIVHDHPNGRGCEDKQHSVAGAVPKSQPTER